MHEYNRINKFLPLMQSLYNTAKGELGFEPHVKIVIIKNDENMENPLGKTAHYSPGEHKIALFTQGRHIKDILRSLSHELVHHNQNCRGDFNSGAATVEGYAQEDGHLREMEREAYECGNMIFRDWEDNLKKKGARPLFTSTHYANAIMEKGEKLMENSLKESQLRNIIRGVIQEMFNDDLSEADNMGMPANVESQEAAEEEAEKSSGQVGAVYKGVQEGAIAAMAGKALGAAAKKVGSAALGAATDKAKELGTQAIEKGASKLKGALDESEEELVEDSGEEEEDHYDRNEDEDEDHIDAIRGHLDALEHDKDYDEDHEDFHESLGLNEEQYAQLLEEYGPMDEGFKDWARGKAQDAGEWARTKGADKAKEVGRSFGRLGSRAAGELARTKLAGRLGGDTVKDFGARELTRQTARKAGVKQHRKEKATAACQQDCNDQAGRGISQAAEQACLTQCDTMTESFFPKDRSIRQKARIELNEALMKRWSKIIK